MLILDCAGEGTSQGEKFKRHLAAKSDHEVSNTARKECWGQREGRGGKAFPQFSALGAGVEHHFLPKGKTPNVFILCFWLSWWVLLSWLPRQLLLKLINEGCIVFIALNMLSTVLLMLSGRRNSCSSSCRESLKYPRGPRSRCEGSDFLCLLTHIQKIKMNLFCSRNSWG